MTIGSRKWHDADNPDNPLFKSDIRRHKMRGRIIKRKGSKNYTIVLQLGLDPATGKRKQQWITAGPSKREAEK